MKTSYAKIALMTATIFIIFYFVTYKLEGLEIFVESLLR